MLPEIVGEEGETLVQEAPPSVVFQMPSSPEIKPVEELTKQMSRLGELFAFGRELDCQVVPPLAVRSTVPLKEVIQPCWLSKKKTSL